jgi:hypothetical protein
MSDDLRSRLENLNRDQLVRIVLRLVDASPELVDVGLPGEAVPFDPGR